MSHCTPTTWWKSSQQTEMWKHESRINQEYSQKSSTSLLACDTANSGADIRITSLLFPTNLMKSTPNQKNSVRPTPQRRTEKLLLTAILTERNFCLHDTHRRWTCCYWSRSLSSGRCDRRTISRRGSCPETFTPTLSRESKTLFIIQ